MDKFLDTYDPPKLNQKDRTTYAAYRQNMRTHAFVYQFTTCGSWLLNMRRQDRNGQLEKAGKTDNHFRWVLKPGGRRNVAILWSWSTGPCVHTGVHAAVCVPITSNETEIVNKYLPKRKGQDWLNTLLNSTHTLQKTNTSAPYHIPKNTKWRNTTKIILQSQYYPNAKTT